MEQQYNPFSLEGKTILVTGASSGIGRQCAIDCSKMGAKVVLVARSQERLEETLSMMSSGHHACYSYDLTALDGIKELVSTIVKNDGMIDGFIHAAGIEVSKPVKLLTHADYEEVYRTNALAAFEVVKQFGGVRHFNNGGSIVFIASISGVIGRVGVAAYAASKGALVSATRVMALEFAKRSIRVNCISPGTIMTPMMEAALNNMEESDREKRIAGFPLGLGKESDISSACVYLLSDASRWITGQNMIVDGGYTAG